MIRYAFEVIRFAVRTAHCTRHFRSHKHVSFCIESRTDMPLHAVR